MQSPSSPPSSYNSRTRSNDPRDLAIATRRPARRRRQVQRLRHLNNTKGAVFPTSPSLGKTQRRRREHGDKSPAASSSSSSASDSRTLRIASAFLDGGSPFSKKRRRSSTCCRNASPNFDVGASAGIIQKEV